MDDPYEKATAEHRAGRLAAAEALYRRALAEDGGRGAVHNALGVVLMQTGRVEEAAQAWRRAADLGYGPALANLGAALHRMGRWDEALSLYDRALARDPTHAEAHYNRASALQALDRLDEAAAGYRAALAARPAYPQAWNNLGIVLRDLGRLDEAVAAYRRALTFDPGHAEGQYNLGMALLEGGDLAEGFQRYEWRFQAGVVRPRVCPQPLWRGEDLRGRTLLVWAEQGLGDSLQYARFVPDLARRGARVVVEVAPELVRLMESLPGAAAVVARGDASPPFPSPPFPSPPFPSPPFHCHVPMASLPARLGTTLATLPAAVPYLRAPAGLAADWTRRLEERGLGPDGPPRVGLVWAGNPKQANDRRRSLPAGLAARLAGLAAVRWVSLQVGAARRAPEAPVFAPGADLGPLLADFADTAAVVEQLDLVISVDTAVAHLAGALGRPAWVLLTRRPDFRYLRDGEANPWYPTQRLVRQTAEGDCQTAEGNWESVVARVAAELERWAGERQPGG